MSQKNLILSTDDFSEQSLEKIQEQAKEYPAVITCKQEFDNVYLGYQNIRKFRIAITKKSEELTKSEKQAFETAKTIIKSEEKRILDIITPIEKKLLTTREAWEAKKKEIADKKASDLAAEQKKEFNRQEIIRVYDGAWEDNTAHDQKILDDIAREEKDKELRQREKEIELQEEERIKERKAEAERLAARELALELKEAWIDAHDENAERDMDSMLEESIIKSVEPDVNHLDIIPEKEFVEPENPWPRPDDKQASNQAVDAGPIMDDIAETIERIESSGDDNLSQAIVQLRYNLDVECPYCKKEYDLCDQEDENEYSGPIFNNKWDDLKGEEMICPHCEMVSTIEKVEY